MQNILNNPHFAARYAQLAHVNLNPRRHTAANALDHSEQVAARATRIAAQNDCCAADIALMENLGRAHDIGKVTGSARPAHSLALLAECGVTDERFLALVKWHDTSLPWWLSAQRDAAPSDKAWRRLARQVDMNLLCMFMVADRVDAPSGWRRNAPTVWMFEQARARGLLGAPRLDAPGQPSEVSAGAALVHRTTEPRVLVIRVRASGYELPKGGIEWDELPREACIRELQEEAGVGGSLVAEAELGHLDYEVATSSSSDESHLKRVRYFHLEAGELETSALPSRTRERRWLTHAEALSAPLVNEQLRPILLGALEKTQCKRN